MSGQTLSRRDIDILAKIKDPEANPSMAVLTDDSLPKDPNLRDKASYDRVSRKEREIILALYQVEARMAGLESLRSSDVVQAFHKCLSQLDELISEQPDYASARNNRVQILRRLYGDNILVTAATESSQALLPGADRDERVGASFVVLQDLESSIRLLSPRSLFAAVSPTAAKTLSMAHTQRGAIYHATSNLMRGGAALDMSAARSESRWTPTEFEEAASRDFAMGGRFGSEIAKGLAVGTNPTAKLCGQMVQEMMKREYGSAR